MKEKFPYFLLGATVILIIYLILAGIIAKNKVISKLLPGTKNTMTNSADSNDKQKTMMYVVKSGDNLWNIAEATYGSGFNAYDIAKANNISNPSVIEAGESLVLPSIAPKEPTKGEVAAAATTKPITFTGDKYTIQHGDNLWNIAEKVYGDGYAWVRIAKVNGLANPSLIHADNVLIIPR